MLRRNDQVILQQRPEMLRSLYDMYGGMLLGYLNGALGDRNAAEEYMVGIFKDILTNTANTDASNKFTWCQLQKLAKQKLAGAPNKNNQITTAAYKNDKLSELMTEEQKNVFYSVYYDGRSIAAIANQCNKTEDAVRKILKEAFTIMRRQSA